VSPTDLVAIEDDAIVGQVLGARGNLGGRGVIGVAPPAVGPCHKGRGIGTSLMVDSFKSQMKRAGRWQSFSGIPPTTGASDSSQREHSTSSIRRWELGKPFPGSAPPLVRPPPAEQGSGTAGNSRSPSFSLPPIAGSAAPTARSCAFPYESSLERRTEANMAG